MNRLTAIGLASLVAYGVLLASKYTGVISIAHEREPTPVAARDDGPARSMVVAAAPAQPQPRPSHIAMPAPLPRMEPTHASPVALEFRSTRDLRAFADALEARRPNLTADERYFLAKALEECQFATSVNEDLAAYSARQRNAFLATLTPNDPINRKRIAAYDAMDNTQRCLRFQGTKISSKEIDGLVSDAAQQGDPRAQARILISDLTNKVNSSAKGESGTTARGGEVSMDDISQLIHLLETRDPETTMQVGNFLASSAMVSQLRIGPQGETPEPSALLGAFSLVACQQGPDCISMTKDPQAACAYGAYCDATSYEQLFQNFLASPWVYSNATRYSGIIMTAINSQNWALIGLQRVARALAWHARAADGSLILRIHVQPGARRTEVAGEHGDALKVRVAAPALEDRANEALVAFIAEKLGLARRDVRIASGARSREKRVEVLVPADPARLLA